MKRLFSQFVDPTEVGALRASVEAGNYTPIFEHNQSNFLFQEERIFSEMPPIQSCLPRC